MGKHNISEWLGKPLNCGYHDDTAVNDPWIRFAAEIVIHAVDDWRLLVKNEAWLDSKPQKNFNFDELRVFFKSEWCAFLMQEFDIEPACILELLEKELREAMQQPARKKKRKGGQN